MPTPFSFTATRFLGLNVTDSPESIGPQINKPGPTYLTAAENVRFNKRGSVFTRKGFEQKTDLGTSAKVGSLGAHENAMFAKSGTKIFYSTDEWATKTDTGESRTASATDFFYPRQDEMFAISATDGLLRFASDYTTPDTLTSVTGTCISELEGSMLVGSGNVIKYSAPSTEANPEYFYDFTGNGAGSKLMPSTVVCLKAGAGVVLVGMAKGLAYAYAFDLDTGALLTRDLQDQDNHGTPSAHCVSYVGNNTFVVFTGRRALLVVGDAAGVRVVDNLFNDKQSFDYPVLGDFQQADDDQAAAWTHFNPTTKQLYVSYLQNGISRIKVCDMTSGAWSDDTGKPYACMVNWKFRAYAGDDSDDKVYLDDEGTTDNAIPIRHRITLPVLTLGDTTAEWHGAKYSGLLSGLGAYTQRVYVNGGRDSLEEDVTAEDLIDQGLMGTGTGVPLGSGTVGAETVGSGGSSPEGFTFRYPWEFLFVGEQAQVEIELLDEGSQMELRKLSVFGETDNELELSSQ